MNVDHPIGKLWQNYQLLLAKASIMFTTQKCIKRVIPENDRKLNITKTNENFAKKLIKCSESLELVVILRGQNSTLTVTKQGLEEYPCLPNESVKEGYKMRSNV